MDAALERIGRLPEGERPRAWVLGSAMGHVVGEVRAKVGEGVRVLVVPQGTMERVGPQHMWVYALGMLDGVFRGGPV